MKPKRNSRRKYLTSPILEPIQPNAAGIDVGATEIYVAVPVDRDPEPVRCFLSFTDDLQAMADWLEKCGIQSVAMESTGVYWIPLFQILEARGIQVCLVNARHVKHVPGRKSDVIDCQWLQYLHSVGLLRASFRPEQAICMIRSLLRHRDGLVEMAAVHIQHMQKALTQMNLQLHHVISDITGITGMAILDAMVMGQHDPQTLNRWGVLREEVCAGMRGAAVEIERRLDGSHWLRFRGRYVHLRACPEPAQMPTSPSGLRPPGLVERTARTKNKIQPKYHVPANHPWRKSWNRTFLSSGKPDISTLR